MTTANNYIADRAIDDLVTALATGLVVSPFTKAVVDAGYPTWARFLAACGGDDVDIYCWIRPRTSPDRHREALMVDKQAVARIRVALPLSGANELTSAQRRSALAIAKKKIVELVEDNRTQGGDAYETTIEDEQEWVPEDGQLVGFEFTWRCQFKYWVA